jgi:carbonic anhydrase/acetyltransferase-like protein (isoleucine patch superfamily)
MCRIGGVEVPVYALGNRVPEIDPSAFVHPDAVVTGRLHIGSLASIWPGAVLHGDYGEIFVGARTSVQAGTVVHATPDLPSAIARS